MSVQNTTLCLLRKLLSLNTLTNFRHNPLDYEDMDEYQHGICEWT